jgi:2'-5' RNA ligase superfamily
LSAPIIVSALFGEADFGWLDGERRAYFPAARNQLRAHLTLFHHLPPSSKDELLGRLRAEAQSPAPPAMIDGLMSLGYGVAYRVRSPQLESARAAIAEAFAGLLIPQDLAHWRPHVTIQNKASPAEAKALLARLLDGFTPRPLIVAGLAAFYYRGGPWEPIAAFRFGGGRTMKVPPPFVRS